jgi:hypothetical protein
MGYKYPKGHIPWNKKEKIIKYCIVCNKRFEVQPCFNRIKCCSRKCSDLSRVGAIPWNKGTKGIMPISWMKGKHHTLETKQKISIMAKKRKGEKASRWNGGRTIAKKGYIYILKPNHPFHNYSGYVPEHRLTIEKHIGRYLKPQEVVHHINGITGDNRIENLMLFNNSVEHFNYHRKHKFI